MFRLAWRLTAEFRRGLKEEELEGGPGMETERELVPPGMGKNKIFYPRVPSTKCKLTFSLTSLLFILHDSPFRGVFTICKNANQPRLLFDVCVGVYASN